MTRPFCAGASDRDARSLQWSHHPACGFLQQHISPSNLDFSRLIYAPILVKLLGKSGFQKSATTGPHVKSPLKKIVQQPWSIVVFDGIPKASQSPIRISPRSTRLPVATSASKTNSGDRGFPCAKQLQPGI